MKNKIKEYLTKDERNLVLRQPDQRKIMGLRDFCILSLMVNTGLRRAEVCGLNRGSLKTAGKKIFLYIFGKGGRERKIPIRNVEMLTALTRYFSMAGNLESPDAPMFYQAKYKKALGPQRMTASTIRYLVARHVAAAGIKKHITAHSLRHTFCTLTLQSGADLATVQALAGHSSVATTSRYLHTSEELMEKAIEKLAL